MAISHNYFLNAANTDRNHQLFDRLTLWDTTGTKPLKLATLENGKVLTALPDKEQPAWLKKEMSLISEKIGAFHKQGEAEQLKPPGKAPHQKKGKGI